MKRLRFAGLLQTFLFGLLGVILAAGLLVPTASANFVVFDEWGKGYACNDGVGNLPGYPNCAYNSSTHTATFKRLGSGLSTDPNTGFTNVLTYNVPGANFSGSGTVTSIEMSGDGFLDGDAVTFSGSKIYVYSRQNLLGTGSCATGLPNKATGCDGIADVPTLPVLVGALRVPEVGVPGNNELIWGVEFDFQSDEMLQFVPPATNPYRDLIGLNAGGQIVHLPVGAHLNPFLVPEPPSFWLALGAGICFAARSARHRIASKIRRSLQQF